MTEKLELEIDEFVKLLMKDYGEVLRWLSKT